MLVLLLVACAPADPPPAPLTEEDELRAMDAAHRAVAIDALTRMNPGGTLPLCALLESGPRARCEETNRRPHLWTGPMRAVGAESTATPAPTVPTRVAGGPEFGAAPPFPALPRAVATGSLPPCPPDPSHATCLDDRAAQAGGAGDWGAISRICTLHTDARWAGECVFHGVEVGLNAQGAVAYPLAAAACLDARVYAANCETHVVGHLGDALELPTADAVNLIAGAWLGNAGAARATRAWALDLFWQRRARALATAPTLPEAASRAERAERGAVQRNLRMFRALALVADTGVREREFPVLVQALSDGEVAATPFVVPLGGANRDSWPRDAPGEGEFPAMMLETGSRRTWSADDAVDRRICVLEALAIRRLGDAAALEPGLGDDNVQVRWTAARLLALANPNAAALTSLLNDSDARVAAYAAAASNAPARRGPPG